MTEELPEFIKESRATYYIKLAKEYGLSVKEVQEVHESLIAKIKEVDPSYLKYIQFALPNALFDFKKENRRQS